MPEADVVICDYNYVFAPRSALGRVRELAVDQIGKPEPGGGRGPQSPGPGHGLLLAGPLRRRPGATARGPAGAPRPLPWRGAETPRRLPAGGRRLPFGEKLRPGTDRSAPSAFQEQDGRLGAFLRRYLDAEVEIRRQDPVLRLCFDWTEFTEALQDATEAGRQEFFVTFQPGPEGGTVKITCCDAAALLKDCYGAYEQVAGFSATLKPFDYYVRLSGLDAEKVRTAEFASPFPPERRKLLIIPQVSTSYRRRGQNYARIADAVSRIAALRRGNYFVFLPSFDFLEQVAVLFRPPAGFAVLRQERSMPASAVAAVVDALRGREAPTIVFAVQGGSFSEGMDYAGETVIGAFVVGPPLPGYDLEREEMRKYYQRQYGAGFDYAYVIPAMAKAVQAAGRVIRSETDRGLIVLLDSRFVEPPTPGRCRPTGSRARRRSWFPRAS